MFDLLLNFAYKVLFFLGSAAIIIIGPFILVLVVYFVCSIIGGKRLKKRSVKRAPPKYAKKDTLFSLLYKIYVLVPVRIIKDIFTTNPDIFKIT